MKKISLLFVLAGLSYFTFGQFSAGISAGPTLSSMSVSLRDLSTFRIRPVAGYNVSLMAEYDLKPSLSLFTNLSVVQKGFNHHMIFRYTPESDTSIDMTSRLTYLELPVYLKFNAAFEKCSVFFGIGPYAAYGFSGNIKTTFSGSDELTLHDKIKWQKQKDYLKSEPAREYGYSDIKRFDCGVAAIFGLTVNNLSFYASYRYGLANLKTEFYQYEKMSNSSLSFSVGYFFLRSRPSLIL